MAVTHSWRSTISHSGKSAVGHLRRLRRSLDNETMKVTLRAEAVMERDSLKAEAIDLALRPHPKPGRLARKHLKFPV